MIDTRQWDELGTIFADEAVFDYRSAGGVKGPFTEVKAWLAGVLPLFIWTQHLVVNRAVDLAAGADATTSRSSFYNPNGATVDGNPWLFVVGRHLSRPIAPHTGRVADRPPGRRDHLVGQPPPRAPGHAVPTARRRVLGLAVTTSPAAVTPLRPGQPLRPRASAQVAALLRTRRFASQPGGQLARDPAAHADLADGGPFLLAQREQGQPELVAFRLGIPR